MFSERTTVRLDVHARSVVACGIDTVTGELLRRRLCPAHGEVLGWLSQLPGPVAVVYEAGPTGFGLARAVRAAGVRCKVAAPSKLQRPAGDRVKTEKDALHLARLLQLDQISSVRVPDEDEEAARDLVRARDDVRGELMRARHRTSKLLLRQGIVYAGGSTWTHAHHAWLRQQRFGRGGLQAAYDASYEAVLLAESRRDRQRRRGDAARRDRLGGGVSARCLAAAHLARTQNTTGQTGISQSSAVRPDRPALASVAGQTLPAAAVDLRTIGVHRGVSDGLCKRSVLTKGYD